MCPHTVWLRLMGIVDPDTFFGADVVLGAATNVPFIKACPVRMPFPAVPIERAGSIYASQTLINRPARPRPRARATARQRPRARATVRLQLPRPSPSAKGTARHCCE